jgi:hydroxypyruvate reductase
LRAAIAAVDGGRLVERALDASSLMESLPRAREVHVIAAGKAAGAMVSACVASSALADIAREDRLRSIVAIGPSRPAALPDRTEWFSGGHPHPTSESVRGARRALEVAMHADTSDVVLVLLSGGGSALMALPADGVTLDDKLQTAKLLMEHGGDIYELNTVRKHLSAIKGGQLAAASRAQTVTLAISDVVGDDLSVIASGPTAPDASTFGLALDVLDRRGGRALYPAAVITRLDRGSRGGVPETPKPGDARLARSSAHVIGRQRGAIEGARAAAESLGYLVHVIEEPVTGEARLAAVDYVRRLAPLVESMPRPACVVSSGETTVTVKGAGKGGRNQEFAFAMAGELPTLGSAVAASIGTDGIDGPTDAAGAIVDTSTLDRAHTAGISDPQRYLDNNDTYAFFDRLGDLVRTGPTSTNVGDIQVVLIGE